MSLTDSKAQQVTALMRALIAKNAFADGRLPSEPTLAKTLGASRATVRQALAALAAEGLIVRRQGSGTFVNEAILNIPTRLEEVWDFAEMIAQNGYTPGVQHISLDLGPGADEVTARLALPPGAEVITTRNTFLADNEPVIYCVDIIPAELVCSAYRDVELQGPVYTFLERRCGQRLSHNIAELQPVVATAELAALLECAPGAPLQFLREISYNAEELPLVYSEEYYRPEYFSFNVLRKMTTAAAPQREEHE